MARRTTVVVYDDVDGTKIENYDGSVEFGVDGASYEIDLSAENHSKLREALADFVAHARKLGKRAAGGAAAAKTASVKAADRKMRSDIREHYRGRTITLPSGEEVTVGNRGRLRKELVDMYLAEMREQQTQAPPQEEEAPVEVRAPEPAFSG